MRTKTLLCLVALMSMILLVSCEKKVVPKDIYGCWKLQNDVKFTGDKAFTLMDLDSTNFDGSWIDPVINDSIYHYMSVYLIGTELVLVTDDNKPEKYQIDELHDDVLVIKDFPGADRNLRFKHVVRRDSNGVWHGLGRLMKATELPKDSLDINMKSARYFYQFADTDMTPHILSKTELKLAHDILAQFLTSEYYKQYAALCEEEPYTIDHFLRRYCGYFENGELYVHINLLETFYRDGLGYFFYQKQEMDNFPMSVIINLSQRKVLKEYFHFQWDM